MSVRADSVHDPMEDVFARLGLVACQAANCVERTRRHSCSAKLPDMWGVAHAASRSSPMTRSAFSGPKAAWLLDAEPDLRLHVEAGDILFGTMDSWLIWNLTVSI